MFQEFPPPRRISPRSAALSLAVHAAVISALIAIFAAPPPQVRARPLEFTLIAPVLDPASPRTEIRRPPPPLTLPVAPPPEPPRAFRPPAPRAAAKAAPKPVLIEPPREAPRGPVPAPEIAVSTPALPPPVLTGTFETQPTPSSRNSALPVQVKAAGFASAAAQASLLPRGSIAGTGGFDASATGESAPRRGAISTGSEFGDAGAVSAAATRRTPTVRGSFGDIAAAAPTRVARSTGESAATVPAEILDKPRPVYTEEARRLSIEGEVLLEVLFESSGRIQVERLIRGLGHGLDESAMAAARQIHFRPARRDGASVDSRAIVHISFQLAF